MVVALTSMHLYLPTNLHLWDDDPFIVHLSADFTKEVKWFLRRHPWMKTSGRKRKATNVKDADVAKQPRRKSSWTAAIKSSARSDKPQVVVEQLLLIGLSWKKSTDSGLTVAHAGVVCVRLRKL